MTETLLSESEKVFILHGVEQNLRMDGRTRTDLRPVLLETDVVSHASGSAHLRLANTDVLVGVKAELETPLASRPKSGRIEFFVDCSANATPAFEGRGGEELATDISRALARAYDNKGVLDLSSLCIVAGQTCWILYVDILVLEVGGNLYDAVSMAVKAALYSSKIPKVTLASVDGGQPEIEISDDIYDHVRLDVSKAPLLLTLTRIGNHCVVDSSLEEESCSTASLLVAVTPQGRLSTVKKVGSGGFLPTTIHSATKMAITVGQEIHVKLMEKLKQEEELGVAREKIGFL